MANVGIALSSGISGLEGPKVSTLPPRLSEIVPLGDLALPANHHLRKTYGDDAAVSRVVSQAGRRHEADHDRR